MNIGEIFFEGVTGDFSTGAQTVNVAFELTPPTTLLTTGNFDMPADGRIRYTGSVTTTYHVAYSFSGHQLTGSNLTYLFNIRQNGVNVTGGGFKINFRTSTDDMGVAYHKVVVMAQNDYISVWATNLSSGSGLSIYNLNIVTVGDDNS
jgi:hypothetical protein